MRARKQPHPASRLTKRERKFVREGWCSGGRHCTLGVEGGGVVTRLGGCFGEGAREWQLASKKRENA